MNKISFECRKCGNQFEEPEEVMHKFTSGIPSIVFFICPLCKSRAIVRMWCAYCDYYRTRKLQCEQGNTTIVPFNVRCEQWKIRSLDKPEVE